MKILIIGATGKLARPVIDNLAEKGFKLRLFSRSIEPSMFDEKHETVKGDLFKPEHLEKAMEGCDGQEVQGGAGTH